MPQSLIRENKILLALFEVSKVINSSFDLEKNLAQTMHVLGDFLEMERGSVFLVDDGTKELRIVAAHGLTKDQIEKGKYKTGEGIVGRVLEKGYPVVVPDVEEEPLFLNKTGSRIKRSGISFLCVPIKFKGESIGVLSADRIFKDRAITINEDIRVLEIVASIIAQHVILWRHYKKSEQEKENLKLELKGKYSLPNIIGTSDKMQEVFEAVHRVANSKATVLLYGESGTGKELIAKAVHYMSPRSKGPFIKFNCASIPEGLLESELFGHEKGAFTGAIVARKGRFESAHQGTLFLDEVGDIPLTTQIKLLRVLQEGEFERVGGNKTIKVNLRIIAASNRDLQEGVRAGVFREDLYYRLNVVNIKLPPLRERKEDLPFLINFFIDKFNQKYGMKVKGISQRAMNLLMDYEWSGNVRELENAIESILVIHSPEVIDLSHLPPEIREYKEKPEVISIKIGTRLEEVEKELLIQTLKATKGNKRRAAELLGINVRTIHRKMEGKDEPFPA